MTEIDESQTVPWKFGNAPLPQTIALARLLRQLAGTVLSMEGRDEILAHLEKTLAETQQALAERSPQDLRPRVGTNAHTDRRVYIDHGRDIGEYNPCFPEYTIRVEGERARGTVSFPVAFEGPPGVVHGGFLAVFFDCAIQHHNCDFGVTGKTTSLHVEYRRPTPILQALAFEIDRSADSRRITSRARLMLDGTVLCEATMEAVAGDRSRLPEVSPRRSEP